MARTTPSTRKSNPGKKSSESEGAPPKAAPPEAASPEGTPPAAASPEAAPPEGAPPAKKNGRKPRAKAEGAEGKKTHRKKGAGEKTIPSSLRLDLPGFAALRALETEMPDQSRVQIVSNALKAMAGQTALLTPIHLRRLSKDDLLLLSGQIADSETMLKEILRKIIRAKIDPVKKGELVDELQFEISKQQELRRHVCRMTTIPITHELPAQVRTTIATLLKLIFESKSVSEKKAYEASINVLSAYTEDNDDLSTLNA